MKQKVLRNTIGTTLLLLFILTGTVFAQSDSLMRQGLKEMGAPIVGNNRVELLMSGHDKFIDLFDAIRQARHHIHLEYFNFRNDSIANALFDLLARKAAEGVEVRAMFDAFGNWSNNQPLKKRHLQNIRERGIEIVKFDPFTFPYINHAFHRDHRKIAVIDGRIVHLSLHQPCLPPRPPQDCGHRRAHRLYRRHEHSGLLHQRPA